jgi:hypothetical protein
LLASFFFSGMEAGVFALSRLRIRQQMRAGRPSARVLHGFLENPENFLWTIVVGNTLANFVILGWLFAVLHAHLQLRRVWFAVVFIALVFLFYAFFDLLPKMLFRNFPNRLCLNLARPFRVIHVALRPLVAVVEWCSRLLLRWTGGKAFMGHLFGNREELRLAMQESAQVFSSEERAMINRVLDLQTLRLARSPWYWRWRCGERTSIGERSPGGSARTSADPPASLGNARRPAPDRGSCDVEHDTLSAKTRLQPASGRSRETSFVPGCGPAVGSGVAPHATRRPEAGGGAGT